MTETSDLPPESELLFQALISQGCTVEKARRIVRPDRNPPTRLMKWGTDGNADSLPGQ